jgi:hypothetical protein
MMVQIDNESGVLECLMKEGSASVPKSRKAFLFFGMYQNFETPPPPLPGEMTDEWKQLFDDN